MLWMVLGLVFGVDMVKACQVYLVWGVLGLCSCGPPSSSTSRPGYNALLLRRVDPAGGDPGGLLLWICHALFVNAEAKARVAWSAAGEEEGRAGPGVLGDGGALRLLRRHAGRGGQALLGAESLVLDGDGQERRVGRMSATVGLPTCSFAIAGVPYENLAKQLLMFNLVSFPLFLQAAFTLDTTGPGANALVGVNLWYTQLPIALVLIALNIGAVVKLEPLATVDSRELF